MTLRTLTHVENVIEIASIVVLSLATIASAWCGYQAALWSGIQTFDLHETERLERDAALREAQADQLRAMDAALFAQYFTARTRGEEQLAEELRRRFRREFQSAMQAWLATDPWTNPAAPPYPFQMPEYRLESVQQAKLLRDKAAEQWGSAHEANTNADNYTLLTVLFATVLFFTGICTKLPTQRMRRATLGIGVVLFVAGGIVLLWFPVAGY